MKGHMSWRLWSVSHLKWQAVELNSIQYPGIPCDGCLPLQFQLPLFNSKKSVLAMKKRTPGLSSWWPFLRPLNKKGGFKFLILKWFKFLILNFTQEYLKKKSSDDLQ